MDEKKMDEDADVIEITLESSSNDPNRNFELRNEEVRTTLRVKISGNFKKDFFTNKCEEASPNGDDNHRRNSVKKTVIPIEDRNHGHQDLPKPYPMGYVYTDKPDVEADLPDAENVETPQYRSISVQTSPVHITYDGNDGFFGKQEQPRELNDTACYDMLINGSDTELSDLFASVGDFSLLDYLNGQVGLDGRAVSSQAEGSMDTLEPEPLVVVQKQNSIPLCSAQDSAPKSALNASTSRKRRRTYVKMTETSAEKKRCPERKVVRTGRIGDEQPPDWTMEPDDIIKKGICHDEGREGSYYVEKILATRTHKKERQFLIKWWNWSEKYNSWEPEGALDMGADLIIKRKQEIDLRNQSTLEVPRFKKKCFVFNYLSFDI